MTSHPKTIFTTSSASTTTTLKTSVWTATETPWLTKLPTTCQSRIGNKKFNPILKSLTRSSVKLSILLKKPSNNNWSDPNPILVLKKSSTIQNLSQNFNYSKRNYSLPAENVASREYTWVNNLGRMVIREVINANWFQIFQRNGLRNSKKKSKTTITS